MNDVEHARAAKQKFLHTVGLPTHASVGIGIYEGKHFVSVSLQDAIDVTNLPKEIDGVKVEYKVVGEIHRL